MNLKKPDNKLKVIQFLNLIGLIKLIIYRMGLSESSWIVITKPFTFLSHCKLTCESPCCQSLCGENHHCIFNISTHGYISRDSGEDIDKYKISKLNICCS